MLACLNLFAIFFKIGLFAFGGGYVILPMIYQGIQTFNLMPASEFSNVVALSQIVPGAIAINAATYVGFKFAGLAGAVAATIGVVLPSLILVSLVMIFLDRFKSSPAVQAVFGGIRPATVGMLVSAVYFFSKTSIISETFFSRQLLHNPMAQVSLPALAVFAATIFLSVRFKMNPIILTILAGIAGIMIF